ncbi:secreted protein/lipoprotein [Streptomyces sp. NPDC005808]|uniref:secreted protein/lipoprotein n=1 Tax=Streptomyces sp. NPDC005808 TaxID=3364734 RepID=UPI0036C34EE2
MSLTLCAALALSGCTSSGSGSEAAAQGTPASPSSTPSAAKDPAETMKKEAIAAYAGYWQEMEKLYADRTGKSAHLDQYAASAALKNAEADAKSAHDRGNVLLGEVALTDQTAKVDASGKLANATVSSCLDISAWQTVDAETKKPVSLPENRMTKYWIVSTVEEYPQGWRVIRDEPQGKPC